MKARLILSAWIAAAALTGCGQDGTSADSSASSSASGSSGESAEHGVVTGGQSIGPRRPTSPGNPTSPGSPTAVQLTLGGSPATRATVGIGYSFTPQTTASTGAVSYSVANKPAWMAFDTNSGRLSGTPTAQNLGIYRSVIIQASLGGVSAALPPFDLTVEASGTQSAAPVSLSWTAPTENTNGSALDLGGYRIYYGNSADSLANVVTVGPGQTNYTFSSLAPGTWYFAVAALSTTNVESGLTAVIPAEI